MTESCRRCSQIQGTWPHNRCASCMWVLAEHVLKHALLLNSLQLNHILLYPFKQIHIKLPTHPSWQWVYGSSCALQSNSSRAAGDYLGGGGRGVGGGGYDTTCLLAVSILTLHAVLLCKNYLLCSPRSRMTKISSCLWHAVGSTELVSRGGQPGSASHRCHVSRGQ